MRLHSKFAVAALSLAAAMGCSAQSPSPNPPPADAAADLGVDAVVPPDGSRGDAASDARTDGPRVDGGSCPVPPTPMGASRAAAMCTSDTMCGKDLACDTDFLNGFCQAECTDNPSQACEAAQCGGTGATCLSLGDGPDAISFCTAVCNPSARTGMPGSCRAGTVCTGWWYTHETGEPDRTGCEYFCSTNAHCPAGMACNTRTGECGRAPSTTLRADGEPCDPSREPDTGPSTQCRGICFAETAAPSEGICGSFINLATTPDCPDSPMIIRPDAPSDENGRTDNLAICIYRECNTDADCTLPLRCIAGEGGEPNYCSYGMGIPAPDGGVRDGGPTDATADRPADAGGTDATADRPGG
jgi:hypothetical protein